MRNFCSVLFAFLFLVCAADVVQAQQPDADLVKYVNPLMGTDSEFSLSNGNTYPAIALPWGMNFWSPTTAKMGDGWMYAYDSYKITGIRQTHQPSPWIGDYAAFAFMPVTGELKVDDQERASWFSHKAEISRPDYYQVYLSDYDVSVEVTPTERAAMFRFTFPKSEQSYILLDGYFKGSMVKIIPEERKIIGYCRNNRGGVPKNFHNYFVATFDKEFEITHTWNGKKIEENDLTAEDKHVGAVVGFKTEKGEVVNVKVASSFISHEQAQLNLDREVGDKDFDTVQMQAADIWNKELGRISVKGGDLDEWRTFYSCLYRTLLFPRKFFELNEKDEIVHYSPYNGKVLPGRLYTDNGFWDTFRAVFPYFTLMQPTLNGHIMEGLVNTYKESGWLPEWASPGHRDCMIGSNSASLIADSYLKGIRGYDVDVLYEAILKNSKNEGPMHSVGRYGVDYYNKLGYIPYDVGVNENVARTLEYCYADFTIMKLAEELGRPQEEVDLFAKRALFYENVFDESTNFMRGKNEDGTWQSPFVPEKWGDAFTEGCSWHYTWSVFHDPQGLIQLMGGNEKFTAKLDEVFISAPVFDFSYYGQQIHEITEMAIAGMGQYAHGNQPIQHMPYLYNYAGQPWKTQKWVRTILDKLYDYTPDGYCGDEDNGQTSAWYVFSALGFYPVAPGTGEYILGSPLFDEISMQLENGKTFVIRADGNSKENVYIQSANLNGESFTKNYVTHKQLLSGGELSMKMVNEPNKSRGTKKSDFPYSFSNELKK
jgi:predicted alpha-1,2-mannosidase